MERERYLKNRVASIRVEPYLAEYARKKFAVDPKSGGIKIPYTYDLYHCIFNSMQKPPSGVVEPCEGNLLICLPDSRMMPVRKHPETYCYLSASSMTDIEQALRQLFNFDFHQQMMDNESLGRPRQQIEVVDYSKENEKYFDLMPGSKAATIRPAMVAQGGLLKKGLASTGR